MIPKIIHYCWFGKNLKPPLVQRCIESWRKYCPDYEIKEWNEDNFDVACNAYVKEAYAASKWAFVADYARLWIVYHFGGVYLDTDVELIRPIDDLLKLEGFFGFEDDNHIATGLGFGAVSGNKLVGLMLADYENVHFLKPDGTFDLTTCPVRNTDSLRRKCPEIGKGINKIAVDGSVLFPEEYFCPMSPDGKKMNRTKKTYSIHWYSALWLTENEQIVHEYRLFRAKCERLFGERIGGIAARFVYLFKPSKRAILKKM